jgi:exosome complex RNA-binding protein Csl4
MHDLFQIGDFVRAKVSNVTPYSVELMTADKGLGKILSREHVVRDERVESEVFPRLTKMEQE